MRWLGDIRTYFPTPVVQILQRDAVERLDLRQLLLEPELLQAVEPDIHLVTMLVELNKLLPDETRATARQVIAQVLADIEQRLTDQTRQAVRGALARAARTRRPRPGDIDWPHTIEANLRHWIPEHRTLVPEQLIGHGRRQQSLARDVVIAVDQSGSMADSGRLRLAVRRRARPACRRCAPGSSRSTRRSPTSRRSSTIRSRCCSACSSAAAPTSPRPSATASARSTGRGAACCSSSRTCSRAATAS